MKIRDGIIPIILPAIWVFAAVFSAAQGTVRFDFIRNHNYSDAIF